MNALKMVFCVMVLSMISIVGISEVANSSGSSNSTYSETMCNFTSYNVTVPITTTSEIGLCNVTTSEFNDMTNLTTTTIALCTSTIYNVSFYNVSTCNTTIFKIFSWNISINATTRIETITEAQELTQLLVVNQVDTEAYYFVNNSKYVVKESLSDVSDVEPLFYYNNESGKNIRMFLNSTGSEGLGTVCKVIIKPGQGDSVELTPDLWKDFERPTNNTAYYLAVKYLKQDGICRYYLEVL